MLSFPNGKINLGLYITDKRPDGYHDIETVFYPIAVKDMVEFIPTKAETSFHPSGLSISGTVENNLCLKAYQLLKGEYPQIPPLQIYLHKIIPMGAGLGGGSADGTFMLQMINDYFGLGIPEQKLIHFALMLGSDCPFFVLNKPVIATGRGEIMEQIELNLSAYSIVIVNPQIHVNTGWAFAQLTPRKPVHNIRQIIQKPVDSWKNVLINDFEKPVFESFPEIQWIKDTLYAKGALYASMSGSGSSVFGIFEKESLRRLDFPAHYFQSIFSL